MKELDFDCGRDEQMQTSPGRLQPFQQLLTVGVSIFGRAIPVELEFEQVELVK